MKAKDEKKVEEKERKRDKVAIGEIRGVAERAGAVGSAREE